MEQTTSFDAYKQKFKQYAARFDASDGRIALKIVHTDAVVTIMDRLCTESSSGTYQAAGFALCPVS